jgi:hypothetical protein
MELNHLGAKGVSTTCVCPYYIDTGMFSGAGCRWPFNYLFPMLNPDYVANRVIYATRSSPIDHHCQCTHGHRIHKITHVLCHQAAATAVVSPTRGILGASAATVARVRDGFDGANHGSERFHGSFRADKKFQMSLVYGAPSIYTD